MSTVPMAKAAPDPTPQISAAAAFQEILHSLDVAVPPVKTPTSYSVALGILGAFLVLMAAAFVALLVFLLWLCVWHLRSAVVSLDQGPYFIFHLPMALLGVGLLAFLLKPLYFRRRTRNTQILTLRRSDEPALFAFVEKLCMATHSRPPASIEVDCEANASARLRSVWGVALVLRVGLPLAAALPVRQFAGILAHEFGHFNQRHGMRGASLIRHLTIFFGQIVFERDRLDHKLAQMRTARNGLANLSYWLAMALIEPTRGVLWLVLLLGELLTCHTQRHMEYDADHFEAHIAGTRDFVHTSQLMAFLGIAAQQARYDLQQAYAEHRLPDDLPGVIVANARGLAEHRDDILQSLEKGRTHWIDTHPCHNDRIRNVQKLGAEGLVTSRTAARHLFADFDGLCQRATTAYYRSVLGKEFNPQAVKLVAATELVAGRAAERQAYKALRRFFRGQVVQGRPVLPEEQEALRPPENVAQTTADLRATRTEMLRLAQGFSDPAEQYEAAAAASAVAEAQLTLCRLFPGNPRVARVQRKATEALRLNQQRRENARQSLLPFERQAQQRLTLALQLLQTPVVARQLGADAAAAPGKVADLLHTCAILRPHLEEFLSLRDRAMAIRVLHSAHQPNAPHQPLVRCVLEANQAVATLLEKLREDLRTTPYPFAHGTAGVGLGAALVEEIPERRDPFATHGCAMLTFDRFATVLFRTVGELAAWAEKVEGVLALETLPDPDTKDQKRAAAEKSRVARNTRRYWIGNSVRAAAGTTLLTMLIWLSISPPTLPAMSWGDAPAMPYRPASFGVVASTTAFTSYQPLPPRGYTLGFPGQSGFLPGQPGFRQPGSFGAAQPGMPGYVPQPGYHPRQPNYPQPYNPQPYRPPTYSPPGSFGGGSRGGAPSPGGHR